MRFSTAIAAALLAAVPSMTARADVGLPPPITLTPKARVDGAIQAYRNAGNAWMGAVVVVIDHGTAYRFFYGTRDGVNPFDANTAVEIGSNTKTFTATALAYVDYYGIMDKDTKLTQWVSIASGLPPRDATLMDLADHRSGLPRTSGDPTPPLQVGPYLTQDQLIASLSHCTSWSDKCVAPGNPLYSNYAYQILGNIIAHYLGYTNWSPMNRDLITEPLGMTHTCLHGDGCNPDFGANHATPFKADGTALPVPDTDFIAAPSGMLWSTATDMTTWLRYNLGEPTTADSGWLDALRPELRTHPAGATGFAWSSKQVAFSDGTSSTIRWKNGRLQGLVSYLGVADTRDTGVFVFVNRDPIPSTPDPDDEDPAAPVTALGQTILSMFP
jgi:CubicO group peptidase (beta-lactamase class C family)